MSAALPLAAVRDAADASALVVEADRFAGPQLRLLPAAHPDAAQALRAALATAGGDWIGLLAPSMPALPWERIGALLRSPAAAQADIVRVGALPVEADGWTDLDGPEAWNLAAGAGVVLWRRQRFGDLDPATLPDATHARGQALLCVRLLALRATDRMAGVACAGAAVEDAVPWDDAATYGREIEYGWLAAFDDARAATGGVPRWLQRAAVADVARFLMVDMQARAPTRGVTGVRADAFHARLARLLRQVDRMTIDDLPAARAGDDVRQALLSYTAGPPVSAARLDAYDGPQRLARVTYHLHGPAPQERFTIDGRVVQPVHAKQRACRFFDRTLLHQRIAWLPVAQGTQLRLELAGAPIGIGLNGAAPGPDGSVDLARARTAFTPGKGGQRPLPAGLAGWKTRLVKALARSAPARHRFQRSWLFIDREEEADDSAEHLYRWVREHHPEINAWFMLTRSSPDWDRLAAEGFRLLAPGAARRLAILNSEHIISSHTDYVFGGLDRALYGDCMPWRYTFLQHGVIKDDLSHWLGPREFDCFVTSSPDEHASIVGDDTPYPYTGREVVRTGLPRHDRLLRIAATTAPGDVDQLLVMPTWRGNLVDERTVAATHAERLAAFARSEYARVWGALLRSDALRDMAARSGKRVVFMPHPNAEPYVDAFDPPPHVAVATARNSVVQQVFARTAGFITDYTSVAFTMALLRRQVFYYQFDRERFYGGDHNWRVGYFDYERDGFGPVALTEGDLLAALAAYCDGGCRTDPAYLARMQHAMPDRDDGACGRVFDSIRALNRPVA